MVQPATEWGLPGNLTTVETDAYLRRLKLDPATIRTRPVDLSLLADLQAAHLRTVPFDTTAIHIDKAAADGDRVRLNGGKGVRCDLPEVYEDVVERRIGGFCFSLNTGWSGLLRSLGFEVWEIVARVTKNHGKDPNIVGWDWTGVGHKNLIVHFGQERYLTDVGFGSGNPPCPIPYKSGHITEHDEVESFKLVRGPLPGSSFRDLVESWTLYRRYKPQGDFWAAVYHLSVQQMSTYDYAMLNYFHSFSLAAPFTNLLTVSTLLPNGDRQTFLYSRQNEKDGKQNAEFYVKSQATGEVVSKEAVDMNVKDVRACLVKHFDFQ